MAQSADEEEAYQDPLPRGRHDADALTHRLALVESTLREPWLEGATIKSLAKTFTDRTGTRARPSVQHSVAPTNNILPSKFIFILCRCDSVGATVAALSQSSRIQATQHDHRATRSRSHRDCCARTLSKSRPGLPSAATRPRIRVRPAVSLISSLPG